MAAAAARRGHTTAIEEETVGSRPAKEVEGRSATARCTEMLVFAAVLVRLLLVTLLALVSGAARGLMLLDVGPSSLAHSACSPTPWEVTAAGSRAVDKATTAVLVSENQARIMASMEAAAAQIQRHARGWAARDFFHGRLMARELMEAAATTLQRAWRGFAEYAAAAEEEARALEELWAEPLPPAAQLMCNRWRALGGDKVAVFFARMAAIADENTHVGWARFLNGHAAVLQRAWRASAAAATWRARCRAAVRVQRAWRTARGLGPEKPRRRKPQSAKQARAQKARAQAPRGGRA